MQIVMFIKLVEPASSHSTFHKFPLKFRTPLTTANGKVDSLLTNYDITKEGGETLTLFRKYTLVSLVFENEANKTKNAPMETPIYYQIVLMSRKVQLERSLVSNLILLLMEQDH